MDTHAAADEHLFTLQEALGNTEKAVGTHVNLSVTVGNPVVEAQALDPAPGRTPNGADLCAAPKHTSKE